MPTPGDRDNIMPPELMKELFESVEARQRQSQILEEAGARSSMLGLGQAYGWASDAIAEELKRLGHKPPQVPPTSP